MAAAILRVLRMLITHVEESGHPEHIPALQQQLRRLLDALEPGGGIHPDDIDRLRALAGDDSDPGDHSLPGNGNVTGGAAPSTE